MKRLAVILPYNEQHMENFTEHFRVMVPESEDLYYKLIFDLYTYWIFNIYK